MAGRISLSGAVGDRVAQFLGGIAGALGLWGVFSSSPLYHRATTGLGTDGWGVASHIHIGAGGAFATEAILTALFVFVILSVTSKTAHVATAAMVIGLTLTAVHLVGISITGTSVNPARALAGHSSSAAPRSAKCGCLLWRLVGAIAALIYRVFHPANGDPTN